MRPTVKFIRMRRVRLAATKAWGAERELNTKIHLAVDALGIPVRAIVTDDPRADCKEAISLIQNLPCMILLDDRGYDTDEIVECAKNSGIQPVIPSKKNRKVQRKYDENLYKNVTSLKMLPFI